MKTRQQGSETTGAKGSTSTVKGRGRSPPDVPTRAEHAAALALWQRALALSVGSRVAGEDGSPPSRMLDLLLKACRGRLQRHLFLPLRLDDRYLSRIVSMQERDLLRQAAKETPPAPSVAPIAPKR
ncbi:hypothetical protein ASF20_13475 [Methylobacterium sp. Leaf88]|nr:hypothetical protein ASF20_13475 [Methylobacterium sp. Leaf88]